MMETFAAAEIETGETTIFIRSAGSGPPVLLLHGFPETHLMWRHVAPLLARNYTVVCADLRGYGRSGCPPSTADHAPYAKRAMARDMIAVMDRLGFGRFSVAGHDRGGRVAYRIAIDHPDRVDHLAVLDVLPTEAAWERADAAFMLDYWPWALLAQPAPLPERILETASAAIVDHAIAHWGSSPEVFSAEVRMAYAGALREGAHPHAICEEYRAAATIDRSHDRTFWDGGRRIGCPTLVLWSGRGPLDIRYADEGGPIALWQGWSDDVQGHSLAAGHFFPEEAPEETAEALNLFFHTRAVRPPHRT
jgi:haloacetate dehalogenase